MPSTIRWTSSAMASASASTFEIDHLFVCTEVGAPEADRLIALGLTEGAPNTHPGQGTSNRRFFFRNTMLELLWVHDEAEAQSPLARRTRLFDRWRQRASGACPFGFCFRATTASASPPFRGWEYAPGYFPQSMSVRIGNNSDVLSEPMLIFMPFAVRPDRMPAQRRQPMEHAIGVREITRVRWTTPKSAALSQELATVAGLAPFTVVSGPAHRLDIGFDQESQGRSASLAPDLPITFHW